MNYRGELTECSQANSSWARWRGVERVRSTDCWRGSGGPTCSRRGETGVEVPRGNLFQRLERRLSFITSTTREITRRADRDRIIGRASQARTRRIWAEPCACDQMNQGAVARRATPSSSSCSYSCTSQSVGRRRSDCGRVRVIERATGRTVYFARRKERKRLLAGVGILRRPRNLLR